MSVPWAEPQWSDSLGTDNKGVPIYEGDTVWFPSVGTDQLTSDTKLVTGKVLGVDRNLYPEPYLVVVRKDVRCTRPVDQVTVLMGRRPR